MHRVLGVPAALWVGAPHQCSLGTAACYLLFMLTRAILMTPSQSKAYAAPDNAGTAATSRGHCCSTRCQPLEECAGK